MHLDVFLFVEICVLLGLNWVDPMMQFLLSCHMFMHISCILTFFFFFLVLGCDCVSCLSFSLSDRLGMAPKRKSTLTQNHFVPGHLFLLILPFPLFMFDFVMRRPIKTSQRTFLNVAFIWSAM